MFRVAFAAACVTAASVAFAQPPILLNYHQIGVSTVLTRSPSPEQLDRHISDVHQYGYRLTGARDFRSAVDRGERVALLTFDDGRKSVITNAFPVLQSRGVTGTVFIIASLIGQDDYLDEDDIRALHESGWEIGNHTLSHAALTDLRRDSLERELEETNQLLEAITGSRPACVAYPFGLHDALVREVVRALNDCAFSTSPASAGAGTDPHAIPRPPLTPLDDRALAAGNRATPATSAVVALGLLTWPLPDDAPIGPPAASWTPTAYRELGDGRYSVQAALDGVRHELSFREGPWALNLTHGRGTYRTHAVGLARNFRNVTVAGAYVVGEGPALGVSYDFGDRNEAWAYYTLNGGLHLGVRLVPVDYTSLSVTYHHRNRRFTAEGSVPVPILAGEGYPLRVAVGYDAHPYVRVSFRAGGNALALRADSAGTVSMGLDMRW